MPCRAQTRSALESLRNSKPRKRALEETMTTFLVRQNHCSAGSGRCTSTSFAPSAREAFGKLTLSAAKCDATYSFIRACHHRPASSARYATLRHRSIDRTASPNLPPSVMSRACRPAPLFSSNSNFPSSLPRALTDVAVDYLSTVSTVQSLQK